MIICYLHFFISNVLRLQRNGLLHGNQAKDLPGIYNKRHSIYYFLDQKLEKKNYLGENEVQSRGTPGLTRVIKVHFLSMHVNKRWRLRFSEICERIELLNNKTHCSRRLLLSEKMWEK